MKLLYQIVCILLLFLSCKKDKNPETTNNNTGKIIFSFAHQVNGQPIQFDTLKYINDAGNHYLVSDIKYFISDVILYKSDGTTKMINEWNDIYYVDSNIPSTLTWSVYDKISVGSYDSIKFVFGITKEKNKSFMFVNPPEVNMAWPDIFGGGYHYMMLDGKWIDTTGYLNNFNFHLGIGQLYKGTTFNTDSITGYVQNYFTVKLPNSSFTIKSGETKEIQIIMQVDSWFKTPYIFDFNKWGGSIMQNQLAMQIAKENGSDIFSCIF